MIIGSVRACLDDFEGTSEPSHAIEIFPYQESPYMERISNSAYKISHISPWPIHKCRTNVKNKQKFRVRCKSRDNVTPSKQHYYVRVNLLYY